MNKKLEEKYDALRTEKLRRQARYENAIKSDALLLRGSKQGLIRKATTPLVKFKLDK